MVKGTLRDTQSDRGKDCGIDVRGRETKQCGVYLAFGWRIPIQSQTLGYEQVLHSITLTASAAQAHDMPIVSHHGLFPRKQCSAVRLPSAGAFAWIAICFEYLAMTSQPSRMVTAGGKTPGSRY